MTHEHEKIAHWFDSYGEAVMTYILIMVRDYQQAEDLTQETFLKAFRNQHSFANQSSIKTWLFSIAHNTTRDYFRKKHPLQHYLGLTLKEIDNTALPEQLVALRYQHEQFYLTLQRLKPSFRQIIIFRKLKGFSTKETSEILGFTESKVKMTLQRALKEFKEELIKGGFEYEAIIR